MENLHDVYLEIAGAALSRRDLLTAMQFGMRAAHAKGTPVDMRSDAYTLLALASLELGAPEQALAYAVGAHLLACRAGDDHREEQAASVVAVVVAQNPHWAAEELAILH